MDLKIRPSNRQDVDVVYQFMCELEECKLDQTAFRAIFLHNLADPKIHYLVAEVEGAPVGFISCHVQYLLHHTGKIAEIQEFYVRPEFRGRRIGRRLIEATEERVRRENAVHLEVATNQRRTETVEFYKHVSFALSHFKLVKVL
ncbi:GNAT family N-acetyltransferase [Tellurirhabdus rosea]|uniref:GNAT family N-acetyltransferase n=1 Tax=Tellurirhabdus rosea TaxID=2674997 RepID=UPI0022526F27|nr:GNAT family N-acetyltransferase [Tellurirhabdus rosea]